MCGIAGVIGLKQPLDCEETTERLKHMAHQLRFRGPDDEQLYADDRVGLAFRRLSIVDLSGGQQPLLNEDGSVVLVANGEIYNHREIRQGLREPHQFKSGSDCESILHLYEEAGIGFLTRLNGMFGICLYDRRKRQVILARDRLGIKPLYYSIQGGQLIFGSELKSLFAHPDVTCDLEWKKILEVEFDHWEYYPGKKPYSYYENVEYLEAGTALIVDLDTGRTRVHRYWSVDDSLPAPGANDARSIDDCVEQYGALLQDSVRLRLMSDVEWGVFLSGGVDSLAIARFARDHQEFHTFTVMCESTLYNGDSQGAWDAARYLGVPNHQLIYKGTPDEYSVEHWKHLLWATELPMCGAEQLFKFNLHRLARQIRPGLKVILLGQGSDEFNGGYGPRWVSRYGAIEPGWNGFLQAIEGGERKSLFARGGWRLQGYQPAFLDRVFSRDFLASFNRQSTEAYPWDYYFKLHLHNLQAYNLWHEDRTSSANGIESRVPFLDHRIVEFLRGLPRAYHAELFSDKAILRRAMSRRVPDRFASKPKVPFVAGNQARFTRRVQWEIIRADHYRLARECLPDSGVADLEEFERQVERCGRDPEYRGVEFLMNLVNMATLQKQFRELRTKPDIADRPIELRHRSYPDEPYRYEEYEDYFRGDEASVAADDLVSLPAGVRVAVVDDGQGRSSVLLIQGKSIAFEIDRPTDPALYQALSRLGDGPVAAGHATVLRSLSRLVESGLLIRRPADPTLIKKRA